MPERGRWPDVRTLRPAQHDLTADWRQQAGLPPARRPPIHPLLHRLNPSLHPPVHPPIRPPIHPLLHDLIQNVLHQLLIPRRFTRWLRGAEAQSPPWLTQVASLSSSPRMPVVPRGAPRLPGIGWPAAQAARPAGPRRECADAGGPRHLDRCVPQCAVGFDPQPCGRQPLAVSAFPLSWARVISFQPVCDAAVRRKPLPRKPREIALHTHIAGTGST